MKYHARTSSAITKIESEHANTVRQKAGECVVILENDGSLPFNGPSRIALYGNGARHTIKGGTGSGDVNSRYVVNVEEGLKDAGFEIVTGNWLDEFDRSYDEHVKNYLKEVDRLSKEKNQAPAVIMFDFVPGLAGIPEVRKDDALKTDTAIYVLSRDSGEGGDRRARKGDFYLSDDEEAAFDTITASFKHSILILNTGGIVSLGKYAGKFSSVVLLSQLGNQTGNICADVLLGISDPSGRLTDSWCFDYSKYPNSDNFSINNGNTDDEYYREGVYVGYRYFDSFGVKPDYPFGYGLGYTNFKAGLKTVELDKKLDVKAEFNVVNEGKHRGRDVIELYIASPSNMLDKPYKELVAFAKSSLLSPGEETRVFASFNLSDVASYCDECESRILESGDYILLAGHNCEDVDPVAVFRVKEKIITERLRNVFGNGGVTYEFSNPGKGPQIDISNISVTEVDPSEFNTFEAVYRDTYDELQDPGPSKKITFDDVLKGNALEEELVAKLSSEQMAKLCVGDYGADLVQTANIVGSASEKVPGAAAETISTYEKDLGIPSMVLADGPAGLRLQPHFKVDKDGKKLPGGEVFGLSYNPFPEDLPEGTVDYYQYCTAIPIATALAQSFNPDLIRGMGKIVGEDMKEYFVHFWLAPGMNIHRNPLCGRNFEYYSEDPLVSGECARAMTEGVQTLGGQGTTIKHFCCNNQEVNRMFSNSHVSERTIRNLYLRGFERAVKMSQPYSVMSSYNLLNGVHTANHIGLCKSVLRDEWGFKGVVMTDWYTSQDNDFGNSADAKYPISSSVECIRSGNDWQMPGCKENVDDIINAVNEGRLSKGELQFCALNIIRMAVKCFKDGSDI